MAWNILLSEQHPSLMSGRDDAIRAELFPKLIDTYANDPNSKCLQVGVPSWMDKKWGSSFISIDLHDQRPLIDYHYDLHKTPFPDNEFDVVICNAVLEHVKDPFACGREIERIMKVGGYLWAEIPFVQPYHPYKGYEESHGLLPKNVDSFKNDEDHGGDYWRFTPQGLCLLFPNLRVIQMMLVADGGIALYAQK